MSRSHEFERDDHDGDCAVCGEGILAHAEGASDRDGLDAIAAVLDPEGTIPAEGRGEALADEVSRLCVSLLAADAEIGRLRELLVFADGAAVSGLGLALADLYAEGCEWAQETLRAAGCHPRGAASDRDGLDATPALTDDGGWRAECPGDCDEQHTSAGTLPASTPPTWKR